MRPRGRSVPKQLLPRRVEALTGARARSASAGVWHSLVVTEEGALYSFGRGEYEQLSHGSKEDEHSPKLVDALRHVRIAAAAAGGYHSLALTEDGTVFSWGLNNTGQLGLGYKVVPQNVEALSGLKVCAVAAADDAGCAVTAAGELFTWGCGGFGRLGHGNTAAQLAQKRVEAIRDEWVVAVSPARCHTIVVTRDGSVFGWGAPDGLGLQNAPTAENGAEDGGLSIMLPSRYPQLACVPRS
jgi:alpha-tubulin suppressor-like RCC1 family protein